MKKIIALIVVLLVSVNCSDHHDKNDEHAHDEHRHDEHAQPSGTLTLDQGKKWQMDTHTRVEMKKMQSTLKNASTKTIDDIHQTANTLKEIEIKLIQGCTMTGESHNQLHVILPKIQKDVMAIKNAASVAEGQKAIAKLADTFIEYNNHFE